MAMTPEEQARWHRDRAAEQKRFEARQREDNRLENARIERERKAVAERLRREAAERDRRRREEDLKRRAAEEDRAKEERRLTLTGTPKSVQPRITGDIKTAIRNFGRSRY